METTEIRNCSKLKRTNDCVVPNPNQLIYAQHNLYWENIVEEGMERLEEPKDQGISCEIVCSMYDRISIPGISTVWLPR